MSPSGLCRVLSVLVRFSQPISPFTGDIVLTPSIQPVPRDEPLTVHRRQANEFVSIAEGPVPGVH
jgi:hypothetical protein